MITNDVAVVVTQHWLPNTSQNREPDCAACSAKNQLLESRTVKLGLVFLPKPIIEQKLNDNHIDWIIHSTLAHGTTQH
jgi:hypothetical protein